MCKTIDFNCKGCQKSGTVIYTCTGFRKETQTLGSQLVVLGSWDYRFCRDYEGDEAVWIKMNCPNCKKVQFMA